MTPTPTRQPIFNIPTVVLVLIATMAAIQALRDVIPDRLDADLLARFAFVPGRATYAFAPTRVLAPLAGLDPDDPLGRQASDVALFFLGDGGAQPWTALTYALLHGGWVHLGLNSVWLLAFGSPVARRFGPLRFLVFMAFGSVAGAVTHYAVDPLSLQPLVGASAAVSACMGAALRFMFQPRAPDTAAASAAEHSRPGWGPRLPLRGLLFERRALAFLVAWFVGNVATGYFAVSAGFSDAPIAWQAHIGGLVFGLLAFPLFDPLAGETIRPGSPADEAR